jgi:ABC-type Fe3+-hydroxamate transport system, periplasmic component
MIKPLSSTLFCALSGALLLTSTVIASAQKTQYPLTIESCGYKVVFEKAPERVVTIGQSSTELFYALGLHEKVVGTSVWFTPVLEEYAAINEKIEKLADNDPSFESILAKKPDLVAAQYQFHVGPLGAVGTVEQFSDVRIPTYVSPVDCKGKDNSNGGDGMRTSAFTMDLVYQEIEELAQIFDIQARGQKLIADLKAREDSARKKIEGMEKGTSAVFWFSSPDMELDPFVAGKYGAPAYMMSVLGIRNIIESSEEWPSVSWEIIAKADPTFIVLAEMSRRRFPADNWEEKIKFLKSDSVTKLLPAVEKDRLIVLDAQTMNPGIRTVIGIESVADSIAALNTK